MSINLPLVGSLTVAITACTAHLPPATCNALVEHWNGSSKRFAEYKQHLGYFRDAFARTKPTTSPGQVLVAKVAPEVVDAARTTPNLYANAFSTFPDVQLAIDDVATDIGVVTSKINSTEMQDTSGQWGTETKDAIVSRLVALDDAKPGQSAAKVYENLFGRMDSDYQRALSHMRFQYEKQCQGDSAEIRSADEL